MEVGWDGNIVNAKAKEKKYSLSIFLFEYHYDYLLFLYFMRKYYMEKEIFPSYILKRLFWPMKFDLCKSYYSKIQKLYLKNILDMMYFNRSN